MKGARWLVSMFAVALTGCGAKHFAYRSATEIPEGPGLLSGNDGAFALYSTRDIGAGSPVTPGKSPKEKAGAEDTVAQSSMSEGGKRRLARVPGVSTMAGVESVPRPEGANAIGGQR